MVILLHSEEEVLLLKIDIEGFELSALAGALQALKHKRIHNILMEYNVFSYGFNNAVQLLYNMTALGYTVHESYAGHHWEQGQQAPLNSFDLYSFLRRIPSDHQSLQRFAQEVWDNGDGQTDIFLTRDAGNYVRCCSLKRVSEVLCVIFLDVSL